MCNSESMPTTPPFPLYFSIVWISLQNSCASSLVRMTSIAVSSPARLPTSPVISMPSMAAQAADATPGMVLSTMMFWARSKEMTPSLKIVRSRLATFSDALRSDTA